jgi:hypothetical protein
MLWRLGAFLDTQGALKVEIFDQGEFLAVSWQTANGPRQQRCIGQPDWPELIQSIGRTAANPRNKATLLHALGEQLDDERVEVGRIVEEADGFLVSGSAGGRYVNRRYPYVGLYGCPTPASLASAQDPTGLTPAQVSAPPVAGMPSLAGTPLRQRLLALQSARQ